MTTPPEPIWDGEHGNTYIIDLGSFATTVFIDQPPTPEVLSDWLVDALQEQWYEITKHMQLDPSEYTFDNVECFTDDCPIHDKETPA
jgi:hypothetical protein